MNRTASALVIGAGLWILPSIGRAGGTAPPNDYAKVANWLCRPDKADGPCHGPLNVLSVAPDGHVTPHVYTPAKDPPIDCFYVYPTSSEDDTPNSDMTPGGEIAATAAQFGQFGSTCRQFAPIYRSVTLHALLSQMRGTPLEGLDEMLGYRDVLDAWHYYLEHDNQGRGVVLIGHSQGSRILTGVLVNDIEARPAASLLVSAILPGASIVVPEGRLTGGTFRSTPVCTRADQFGCVIAFWSFRDTLPPRAELPSRHDRAPGGFVDACTNPAALGTGNKALLDPILPKGTTTWTTVDTIDTNYVRVPGLVNGQCVTRGPFRYLEVSVNADPRDPRTDAIPGDVMVAGKPDAAWGLHKVDIALTLGNLLQLVDAQSRAWLAARKQ